jgi:hypothetical protein
MRKVSLPTSTVRWKCKQNKQIEFSTNFFFSNQNQLSVILRAHASTTTRDFSSRSASARSRGPCRAKGIKKNKSKICFVNVFLMVVERLLWRQTLPKRRLRSMESFMWLIAVLANKRQERIFFFF